MHPEHAAPCGQADTGKCPNKYYYAHNHLYSCVALLDDAGAVVERYEYNAYGKPTIYNADFTQTRTTSQYSNNILFTGREVDFLDSGSLTLQYNRNRYYDYDTGRWLTYDPLGYVDCLNLYEYAVNRPTVSIDPFGFYIDVPKESLVETLIFIELAGVTKYTVTLLPDGNTYRIEGDGVEYLSGDLASEIIAKMIDSPRPFSFSGNDRVSRLLGFTQHIAVREGIV